MPAGRPTKYKPEYCEQVLDLFKQGKSIATICLKLNINKSTFYLWKEEHEEFSNAIKEGVFFSQGWWEEQGQEGIWADTSEGASRLNYTGWFMNMKNRFKEDWKDKHETQEEKERNIPEVKVHIITNQDQLDGEDS